MSEWPESAVRECTVLNEALENCEAEVRRLNTEILEWKLACGARDEDIDKDVLTVVRERDAARAENEKLREALRECARLSEHRPKGPEVTANT